jgi:hypothetical protein
MPQPHAVSDLLASVFRTHRGHSHAAGWLRTAQPDGARGGEASVHKGRRKAGPTKILREISAADWLAGRRVSRPKARRHRSARSSTRPDFHMELTLPGDTRRSPGTHHAYVRNHRHQGSQAFPHQAIQRRNRSILAGRNDDSRPGAIRFRAQVEHSGALDHHNRCKNACRQAARFASYASRMLLNNAKRCSVRNRGTLQARPGSVRSRSSRRAFS